MFVLTCLEDQTGGVSLDHIREYKKNRTDGDMSPCREVRGQGQFESSTLELVEVLLRRCSTRLLTSCCFYHEAMQCLDCCFRGYTILQNDLGPLIWIYIFQKVNKVWTCSLFLGTFLPQTLLWRSPVNPLIVLTHSVHSLMSLNGRDVWSEVWHLQRAFSKLLLTDLSKIVKKCV